MSAANQIEWGGRIGSERTKDAGISYGKARRRMYKAPREAARLGAAGLKPPLELPDATPWEVSAALAYYCDKAGITVGDCPDYDALRDEYTCIAKDRNVTDPKDVAIKDVTVQGSLVAMLISFFRQKRAHQRQCQARAGMMVL